MLEIDAYYSVLYCMNDEGLFCYEGSETTFFYLW